jgi:RNA polymerase sigma-70 factor, ECF subfamily
MISNPPREQVTRLLIEWGQGDSEAANRLIPLVYDEMRQLARGYLHRERPDHTLQPTGLVHEAYLRLVDQTVTSWQNRAHFLAVAAQAMRRILVNHARKRRTEKRGGTWEKLEYDDGEGTPAVSRTVAINLVALDEALHDLAKLDVRQSQVVELRFFGGLTNEEVGEVLQITPRTVIREWKMARAWLHREIFAEKNDVTGD